MRHIATAETSEYNHRGITMAQAENSRRSSHDTDRAVDPWVSIRRIDLPKNFLDIFEPDDTPSPFAPQPQEVRRGESPCLCGCGKLPKGKRAKFVQGHDMKAKSKIREAMGLLNNYDLLRKTVDACALAIGGQGLVDWIHAHPDWYEWLWHFRQYREKPWYHVQQRRPTRR